jgi:hypothetical protein
MSHWLCTMGSVKKMRSTKLFHTATTFVAEIDISNDFLVTFAGRPMFQFTFATNEGDLELLLQKFREKICRVLRWRDESGLTLQQAVLKFDKTVFVHLRNCPCPCVHVYADTAIRAEALEKKIRAVLPPTVKKADEPFFFMLRREGTTVMPQKVTNTVAPMDDESMRLCYGDDALNWIDGFADQTSKKLGGITILDGPPGVGKSTLISQLMRRLYQTHAFYVLTVAQHESLSNESMVEFWQEQNGRRPNEIKVVIIEDAEKILLQRRSDNDEAVSALLNIADGLMGQMLRLHVLCTLNQGMEHLDPAMLRPGRLRGYRYVSPLSGQNAEKLAAKHKLPFVADKTRVHYTMAEIFHGHVYEQKPSKILGFQRPVSSAK